MAKKRPIASIIITAHNYGRYLEESIESAVNQNFDNYEVIVVDDGSTDNTPKIIKKYKKKYPSKIKAVTLDGVGLSEACNKGVKKSKGKYIVRLDADDYFDENLLLVEVTYLEKHPKVDMVYPDYFEVDEKGNLLNYHRNMKVGKESKLLDRAPIAIGAMYRRSCYDKIGGYDENLKYQENYEFWAKFTEKYKVQTINIPLMYYRRHGNSMSSNEAGKRAARRKIKKKFAKKTNGRTIALIPARGAAKEQDKLALIEINGKPLIYYTIREALKVKEFENVYVSTEDEKIADVSRKMGANVLMRPRKLATAKTPMEKVVLNAVEQLDVKPEVIAILQVPSPLKKAKHIKEAINTMKMYDVDSVISVYKTKKFYWRPGMYGLTPLFKKRLLKQEKEGLYAENGAIYLIKTENLRPNDMLGKSVGNIIMSRHDSFRVRSKDDIWLLEKILEKYN
ncbi:MAG: glycosyltransferase [Candidatus Undinarchaeales archaeon]